jgi:hypothetical protein
MGKQGEKILTEQNTDFAIKLLASQRSIYSSAKTYFYFQCVIAIPIPIIISLIGKHYKVETEDLSWVFALYLILSGIATLFLEKHIKTLKSLAAGIQELFDCKVLEIKWNSVLIHKKPSTELIDTSSEKFLKKNDNSKLLVWYSKNVELLTTNIATLICQSTNCTYDSSFRKKVNVRIFLIALLTFLIILVISLLNDLTLKSFFTNVLIPSFPIFILAWKQYIANDENLEDLIVTSNKIESILSHSHLSTEVNTIEIRQIQDRIYNSRKNRNLLPDWIFFKFRNKLEKSMDYIVAEKIDDLKNHS